MTLVAKSISWTISNDKDDNLGNKVRITYLSCKFVCRTRKFQIVYYNFLCPLKKKKKWWKYIFLAFYWTARNFVFSRATLFFGGSFLRCRISLEKSFNFFIFYFSRIITRISWSFFFCYVFLKLKFWQVKVSYFLCYLRYAVESLDVIEGSFTSSFGNPFLNLTEIKREY